MAGVFLALIAPLPARADTIRQGQWYLDLLHVADAQKITTGQGVVVAVIDKIGVDNTAPELQGQVLEGTSIGTTSRKGWSTDAKAGHATSMAAIIAAKGGGDNSYLGIAPAAKILPIGIPEDLPTDKSAEGIRWAADHGAKIISISISGDHAPDATTVDAVKYAMSKDIVVVAAAGNHDLGNYSVGSPARVPGVVAVSGTDRDANLWNGSATGPEVAIAAPAKSILVVTTKADSPTGYITASGTSISAPIVAGAAALIRAKYPNLNAANVINRLVKTAKDQGTPGRDDQYGFGTIRILDALTADVPTVDSNPLGTPTGSAQTPATRTTTTPGKSRNNTTLTILGIIVGFAFVFIIAAVAIIATRASRKRRTPNPPFQLYPNQPPPRP